MKVRLEKLGESLHWLVGRLGQEKAGTLELAALLQGAALSVMLALSLPVGAVTALLGGALFLGLLYRRGRV